MPELDDDSNDDDMPDELLWDGEDNGFYDPEDEDDEEPDGEFSDDEPGLEQEDEDEGVGFYEGGNGVDMNAEEEKDSDDDDDDDDEPKTELGLVDEEDEEDDEDDENDDYPTHKQQMKEMLRAQGDAYDEDEEDEDEEEDDEEEEDDDDYDEIKAKYDAIMAEQAAEKAQAEKRRHLGKDSEDEDSEEDEEEGDVEDDDEQEEASDDEAPTKSGFNNILKGILGRDISGGQGPILAQRPSLLKKVETDAREGKIKSAERQVKKELLNKDAMTALETDVVFEKNLLRIATRGVVKFFSAVANQNQAAAKSIPSARGTKVEEEEEEEEEAAEKPVSKDTLMAALKSKPKTKTKAATATEKKKAGWMDEDYATKDKGGWDQEDSDSD